MNEEGQNLQTLSANSLFKMACNAPQVTEYNDIKARLRQLSDVACAQGLQPLCREVSATVVGGSKEEESETW